MKKDIVIFDFDGTIADTLPVIKQIIIRLAKSFGFKTPSENQIDRYRSKQYKTIIKELQIPLYKIPFLLQAGRKKMLSLIPQTDIFPGMKPLITKLVNKDYIVAILTSNSKINVQSFLNKHKIPINIIHSEFNLFGKGNALNRLIKQYNWNKNKIVYIGDETRDIEACKKAKIDIIAVSWGFNKKALLNDSHPTLIANQPEDIYKFLSEPSGSTQPIMKIS